MLTRKHIARGGFAAVAALAAVALAAPMWAGQVNLSSRTTVISQTTTTGGVSGTTTQSINQTGISQTINSSAVGSTVTTNSTITEVFNSQSATVSFEVAQDDLSYTSPFDNTFIAGSITQSITISSTFGAVAVQNAIGAGNVSVASNGVLSGTALSSITSTLGTSTSAGGTQAATLALTPGFALQNSNAVSLVQAAAVAIAGGGGAVTAIDIQQSGVSEYSPNGNLALSGSSASQSIGVNGTGGVGAVQNAIGAGNVQASHTVILYPVADNGSLP